VRHRIFRETMSVRERMATVLDRLSKGSIQLDELLIDEPGREALVTTLLAILELWRQQSITVIQAESLGSITLLLKEAPNGSG